MKRERYLWLLALVSLFGLGYQRINSPPLIIDNSATTPPLQITERSTAPSSPSTNQIYLDDGTNGSSTQPIFRRWTGVAWENIGSTYDLTAGYGDSYRLGVLHEQVTIAAGASTGVTSTLTIPQGATVFDVLARVTQAPGGGPTQWNAHITAMSDYDSLFDAVAVTLNTTATAMKNTDGTFIGPFVASRSGASTITVRATDGSDVAANVSGASLVIRFILIYSLSTAPTS